jgi:hypothetical protein
MTPTITVIPNTQSIQAIDIPTIVNAIFTNPYVIYGLSPAVCMGIVIFIFARVYKLGGFMQKIQTAFNSLNSLSESVQKLDKHVGVIKTYLVTNQGLDSGLFGPGSPLKLLPAGLKLLEKTGFKKIYKDNKKWFIEEAKKYNHKTEAEIDEASYKVMQHCHDKKEFTNFKEIAFQNGVSIDVLLRALSIYLREELVKELLKSKS